ncbi:hypothetical protein [Chitinophaga qingshengii]|uniref:DUF1640 domain-containing protein n=1 Tax=Chitinophaga qingshengii TaxID=1569794 RepID=A0ABR7TEQ6_9BACT|nr:hypothetical protein [Chitinophaga qingshengii]MBC9928746.1 hypothetical protein [Chitinophaga qingshengii]
MIANNIKIYDIFRKDLHLEDEKARELVSEMDDSFNNYQVTNFATKLQVQELSGRMDQIIINQHSMKGELTEVKTEMRDFRNEINTKLDGFKNEVNTKLDGFKSEVNTKLDGFKSEVDTKLNGFNNNQDGFKGKLDEFKDKMNEGQVGLANFQTAIAIQMKNDFEKIYSKMNRIGILQYVAITGTLVGIIASLIKLFK